MSLLLREHVSLKPYNTFALEGAARWFAEARTDAEVDEAIALARALGVPLLPLGGGSNLLLTGDVPALVLRMGSRGTRRVAEQGPQVIVEAEAGEPWHPFVSGCLASGLYGLENLSLIPGTVGAAPIQNIGAYGVEIKDRFAGLDALDLHTGERRSFDAPACAFGYRDSRFKRELGRWLILRVRFALRRTPEVTLDYGPIRQRLAEEGITRPRPEDVSRVICALRTEKLPDPAVLPNAGSFFKNPVVTGDQARALASRCPDLVAYSQADGRSKLAAGWLIERAGWKGFREGDAGVHGSQALVLVNHGQATGEQVMSLAKRIQADVSERFGVVLEMEPVLL
ncbi:UDP-N-acetylmuramate dehydrogenase [Stutzerimonas tarimensis]|uniref:UDP-N-acetylenolpyruvoylglucosamine reductase n=1 Tax=Stutzerimonas tarimensis TaxID=1507735 RepID=A0ABV7T880_9GAMM